MRASAGSLSEPGNAYQKESPRTSRAITEWPTGRGARLTRFGGAGLAVGDGFAGADFFCGAASLTW